MAAAQILSVTKLPARRYNKAREKVMHMRDIGKNIRDARVKGGITQDQLAERLHVSRQTISHYETGHTRPDIEILEQIAQALNIPREEVVFAMDAIMDPVSLYEPVYSDGGDAICVMDQVRDVGNTDDSWLEQISMKQAMSELSDREKRILALRFYDGKTQMEVAREVGISQAQVSRRSEERRVGKECRSRWSPYH